MTALERNELPDVCEDFKRGGGLAQTSHAVLLSQTPSFQQIMFLQKRWIIIEAFLFVWSVLASSLGIDLSIFFRHFHSWLSVCLTPVKMR